MLCQSSTSISRTAEFRTYINIRATVAGCACRRSAVMRIGLNPYGLTYTLGMQGAGTPRANPSPGGLPGFLSIAAEIGVRSIELDAGMLVPLDDSTTAALRDRLQALDVTPVISAGLATAAVAIAQARGVGA